MLCCVRYVHVLHVSPACMSPALTHTCALCICVALCIAGCAALRGVVLRVRLCLRAAFASAHAALLPFICINNII